jgi:DNA replication protein DnaC
LVPRIDPATADEFRRGARKMFFSKRSIEAFLEKATPMQVAGVCGLISDELESREAAKKARLLRKAKFPVAKSLAEFDYSDVVFPEGYSREDLESLDFVRHAQDFVFFGKTGRGKTHLSVALGVAAVEAGLETRFFGTAQLVRQLTQSSAQGTLDSMLKDIGKADLIILDEFGYIPLDIDGARLLFQVISDCYERRSLILTTNIEFGKWGTIFADEKLAAAAVDRIVHHGRLVEFGGTSRRMDGALMLGKDPDD